MATTQLKLYNGALIICKCVLLDSTTGLTENVETRYVLDAIWNDGAVDHCLEQGQWRFAMRSSKFDYDSAITVSWGYRRAFAKPSDWKVTSALSADEYFNIPLNAYLDEAQYWYADVDELYVRYVSNDASYGNNLSAWPDSFTQYVKAYLAWRAAPKLVDGEAAQERIEKDLAKALLDAKNRDAMAGPTKFPPPGGWNSARHGRWGRGRERGNRNQLIG